VKVSGTDGPRQKNLVAWGTGGTKPTRGASVTTPSPRSEPCAHGQDTTNAPFQPSSGVLRHLLILELSAARCTAIDVLAYDSTGSYRDAAEMARCSQHTVAHWVQAREEGRLTPVGAQRRPMLIDEFLPKLEKWVDRSRGKIRADVACVRG
jgi:hypothetical protein